MGSSSSRASRNAEGRARDEWQGRGNQAEAYMQQPTYAPPGPLYYGQSPAGQSNAFRSRTYNHPHTGGLGPHAHPPTGQAPPAYYPTPPVVVEQKREVRNTSTVRNLVNLKKPTLTACCLEGKPHLWKVSFTFDATAPCFVSIFPMATEVQKVKPEMPSEPEGGMLVTKHPVAKRVAYEKGKQLTFPPADLEDAEAYCIDTRGYTRDQLHHANLTDDSYPLIIRIETLGEDSTATPSGADISTMELGCAQPKWLQSQTTYAVLGEENGQGITAKVVKQKIWVNGASYNLQEIYGIMDASNGADADGESCTECVVCLTNPKNTTVLPCRHFCMCSDCARALLNQSKKCPMCRLNITSVLQINIALPTARAPVV